MVLNLVFEMSIELGILSWDYFFVFGLVLGFLDFN